MAFQYIRELAEYQDKSVTINGWVANTRESKGLVFLTMRDGSGYAQAVISLDVVGEEQFEMARQLTQESAIRIEGVVVKDERQQGGYELQVSALHIYQIAVDFPITPKEHGAKFLMDNRHLWLRSRRQWAIMRIRNAAIMAIHHFFQERGFLQMDAPILTGNASEGTSDLFETDFYDQPAYLSQSGQLYGEAMAMAQGLIYTFGPTFRAEKSVTRRHLSEFWMIEPEMAFYDLEMDMNLIEDFLRSVVNEVIAKCGVELQTLERNTDNLLKVNQPFPRVLYTDAVTYLRGEKDVNGRNSITMLTKDIEDTDKAIEQLKAEIAEREEKAKDSSLKKGERKFNETKILELRGELSQKEEDQRNFPKWLESARNFQHGEDLGGSDETVLTRLFDSPIMVYHWPTPIKAFYMKEVEGDPRFVKGVDVLAPEGYGEIVGGSERETDLDILLTKIKAHNLPQEAFEWYLDLRRFGSVPHAGFGLGLERLICWICGIREIREAIPFARRYGRLFP